MRIRFSREPKKTSFKTDNPYSTFGEKHNFTTVRGEGGGYRRPPEFSTLLDKTREIELGQKNPTRRGRENRKSGQRDLANCRSNHGFRRLLFDVSSDPLKPQTRVVSGHFLGDQWVSKITHLRNKLLQRSRPDGCRVTQSPLISGHVPEKCPDR